MEAVAVEYQTREEWLQARGNSLGGSDLSAILGLNQYRSPYDVWLLKTGREQSPVENNHMVAGRFLERAVSDWFEYETEHKVIKASEGDILLRHSEYPFLVGSADRRVFFNGSQKHTDKAVMEIKTTGMNIDIDDIPKEWFIQVTYYAGLLGYENIIICWYDRIRNNIDYKEYKFDKDLYDIIIEEAVSFWNNHILADVPPPAINGRDNDKMFPESKEDKVIVATDEVLTDIYSPHDSIKKKIKEMKGVDNGYSDQVKLIMKDAERMVTPNMETIYTYKTGKRGRTLRLKEI